MICVCFGRNLCAKIELVEFVSTVEGKEPDINEPHHILQNIYNPMQGPLFCSAAYTNVWYHSKIPISFDEIKIRLPDIVSDLHWIKVTVQHIHVKPKVSGGRVGLLGVLSSHEPVFEPDTIPIGVGFLPLLPNGSSLLPDREHIIAIYDNGEAIDRRKSTVSGSSSLSLSSSQLVKRRQTMSTSSLDLNSLPAIKITSKSLSTFASTCPLVQRVLRGHPAPLGRLPTSILPLAKRDDSFSQEIAVPSQLAVAFLRELQLASTTEIGNHFMTLMRQLFRSLTGGSGVYSSQFSDPYINEELRCQAFLTMLDLFGRLVPDVTFVRDGEERNVDMELLTSYTEFLFDEEMPLPPPSAATSPTLASTLASASASSFMSSPSPETTPMSPSSHTSSPRLAATIAATTTAVDSDDDDDDDESGSGSKHKRGNGNSGKKPINVVSGEDLPDPPDDESEDDNDVNENSDVFVDDVDKFPLRPLSSKSVYSVESRESNNSAHANSVGGDDGESSHRKYLEVNVSTSDSPFESRDDPDVDNNNIVEKDLNAEIEEHSLFLNQFEDSSDKCLLEDSYLDYLYTHYSIQAERLIVEELIQLCVDDLVESGDDAMKANVLSSKGLRWWSEEIFRTSSSTSRATSGVAPIDQHNKPSFDSENVWFRCLEKGLRSDDDDITISSHSSAIESSVPPSSPKIISLRCKVETVLLQTPRSKFRILEGFSSRQQKTLIFVSMKIQMVANLLLENLMLFS